MKLDQMFTLEFLLKSAKEGAVTNPVVAVLFNAMKFLNKMVKGLQSLIQQSRCDGATLGSMGKKFFQAAANLIKPEVKTEQATISSLERRRRRPSKGGKADGVGAK